MKKLFLYYLSLFTGISLQSTTPQESGRWTVPDIIHPADKRKMYVHSILYSSQGAQLIFSCFSVATASLALLAVIQLAIKH